MRLLSKLRAGYPGLALMAALVTATGPAVTASATPLPTAQHGPGALATARTALEHLLAGTPPNDGAPGCQGGTASVDSPTWAGYALCSSASTPAVDLGGGQDIHPAAVASCPPALCYTAVWGHFAVPLVVRCEDCFDAFWLGLDGLSSDTIEQLGVFAEQSGGSTVYYTWWDMYPSGVHIVGTTVRAGDSIAASVQREGASYTLSLTDATTPASSFTVTQSCASCANSSAEWITQAQPGIPLADFGAWQVTSATAAAGSGAAGIGAFPHAQITMIDQSGTAMVRPGSLSGTGFTNVWGASA